MGFAGVHCVAPCSRPLASPSSGPVQAGFARLHGPLMAVVGHHDAYSSSRKEGVITIGGEDLMRPVISIALFVVVAFLTSCANVSETYGPDGSRAYSIDCSGAARTWANCFEKAGEICTTRGYDVLNRTGDQGAVVSGSFGGTVMTRGMVIKCKS